MKKYIFSFLILIFLACSCSDRQEIIPGKGESVRKFLFARGIVVPLEIIKANTVFSEVTIYYGPLPRKWTIQDETMIWVSGSNNPDCQISFLFKLHPRDDKIIAAKK